jgi:hypothetical protein
MVSFHQAGTSEILPQPSSQKGVFRGKYVNFVSTCYTAWLRSLQTSSSTAVVAASLKARPPQTGTAWHMAAAIVLLSVPASATVQQPAAQSLACIPSARQLPLVTANLCSTRHCT